MLVIQLQNGGNYERSKCDCRNFKTQPNLNLINWIIIQNFFMNLMVKIKLEKMLAMNDLMEKKENSYWWKRRVAMKIETIIAIKIETVLAI